MPCRDHTGGTIQIQQRVGRGPTLCATARRKALPHILTNAPHHMSILRPIDKDILRIALPAIVTNITVPLLGLVDLAITGHIGSASYIGAIAVGGMIFNVVYWVFGFLRMGTSGMTSQALGRADYAEAVRLLLRSLTVGLAVGLCLVAARRPLLAVAVRVIGADGDLLPLVHTYYNICVWGAPAMLCLYGLTGWFIGMQDTKATMVVSVSQNVVNIAASLLLVYGAGMSIDGVATGTLVAQYAGLVIAIALLTVRYRWLRPWVRLRGTLRGGAMRRFFTVNRDIFLRTLFLMAVNLFFVSAGTSQGTGVLAVNTLLMQLFTLFSYVMDGFAFAGEALCGKCKGAADTDGLMRTIRRLMAWGCWLATAYTLIYVCGGEAFLSLLTDDAGVLHLSHSYMAWAMAIPAAGMAAFVWDGVFVGITDTRGMLISSVVASALFFMVYAAASPLMHNHGLWLAFIVYLTARGAVQTVIFRCRRAAGR